MSRYANVIIDMTCEKLDKTFQYRVPEWLDGLIFPGMCVSVPFGKGDPLKKAYVLELTEEASVAPEKMKEIASLEEGAVPIESHLIALAAWMKKNYGGTMNAALKTVLPVRRKSTQKEKKELVLTSDAETAAIALAEFEKKHHVAKARLLSELLKNERLPYEVVTTKLHVAAPTIRSLAGAGLLSIETHAPDYRNPVKTRERSRTRQTLNADQNAVCEKFFSDYRAGRYGTYLLHGVTGSGKTEVYMTLIEEIVLRGQQAIVLIPEIALTYQTVMRFYDRFGDRVSILNSRMTPGERYDQYLRAKAGELDVMIGPRSALFTPFPRLGLIVIDEEHEGTYKSETVPRYHARETAIARAEMCGASVLLGSATPSIESFYRAKKGEYTLLTLPNRVSDRELAACEIVDLREELKSGNRSILSRRLTELISDRLQKKEQTMLFLNRRGMSGFLSCRSCGEVVKCPHCDVSLSLHKDGRLHCHYCGYQTPMVKACPSCGSKYIGAFRAGTEKIEEIVRQTFPAARTLRMDLDTTKEKGGYERILSAFAAHEADILIGTQMIVKGHDFPDVTLVGVLAADLSLFAPDFHAPERTFDLLTQAAGRAGRGERAGNVVIQTYAPEHYSVRAAAAQDYEAFYREEISSRSTLNYPPIGHLLTILLASENESAAASGAETLAERIRKFFPQMTIIGPADAAIAKVNDVYKKVLYLKSPDYGMLVRVKDDAERWTRDEKDYRAVSVRFDFDPVSGF